MENLLQQLKWADGVIWLAALVGDGACALNPEITIEINQKMVQWLADNYSGRIVFMSTCSVYGAQDAVLDENSPTNPLSVYAVTKLGAESYLSTKNAIIFRLGTLFGVGDQFSRIRLDLVVNTLTVRAYLQGKISVFGGEQFRPLLHVIDAAQAAVDHVQSDFQGIFNLHSKNICIVDLAYQIKEHFPGVDIEQTPMNFQDTRNYRVSSEKAHHILNFNPCHSIDNGIQEIKGLLEQKRLKNVENPRYTNQTYLAMFNTHKIIIGGEI
jgi:nucleoside-diphosphate-sugar epimerase